MCTPSEFSAFYEKRPRRRTELAQSSPHNGRGLFSWRVGGDWGLAMRPDRKEKMVSDRNFG